MSSSMECLEHNPSKRDEIQEMLLKGVMCKVMNRIGKQEGVTIGKRLVLGCNVAM